MRRFEFFIILLALTFGCIGFVGYVVNERTIGEMRAEMTKYRSEWNQLKQDLKNNHDIDIEEEAKQ